MAEERIDWVRGTPHRAFAEYAEWREAVERADKGDSSHLIAMLRSEKIPGPEARALIADMLSRRPLSNKRGRQATPAYLLTASEARLHNLRALVRYFQRKGCDLATAMQSALREEKRDDLHLRCLDESPTDAELDEMISESEQLALENFINGRRGSTQRMKRRLQRE